MASYLATWINLDMLPARQRLEAFTEVAERAATHGIDQIAEHAERGMLHERHVLELERGVRHRAEIDARINAHAMPVHQRLERSLRGLDKYLDAQVDIFGEESMRGQSAIALRYAIFPDGIDALMGLSPAQMHARVRQILERMSSPELADAMGALSELVQIVDHIRRLHHQLGEALHSPELDLPNPDELRAARRLGHERLCETVVLILAHSIREAPAAPELIGYLLEPIEQQKQAALRRGELPEEEMTGMSVITTGSSRGAVVEIRPGETEASPGSRMGGGRLPGMEPGGVPGVDLGSRWRDSEHGGRAPGAAPDREPGAAPGMEPAAAPGMGAAERALGSEEPGSTVLIGGTEPSPRRS